MLSILLRIRVQEKVQKKRPRRGDTARVLRDLQTDDIYAFLKTIPAPPAVKDIPLLRQAAGRVFARQFARLARRREVIAPVAKLMADPNPVIRMQAVRSLWQAWYWNADVPSRATIEETILTRLGEKQHPWVETNLRATVYNRRKACRGKPGGGAFHKDPGDGQRNWMRLLRR